MSAAARADLPVLARLEPALLGPGVDLARRCAAGLHVDGSLHDLHPFRSAARPQTPSTTPPTKPAASWAITINHVPPSRATIAMTHQNVRSLTCGASPGISRSGDRATAEPPRSRPGRGSSPPVSCASPLVVGIASVRYPVGSA